MELESVIGLEVHAQLLTRSKIFCGCSTSFGASPNSHTCPVCLGLPGALPVLNREAVALGVKTALALGCQINLDSRFARKNYFYPDLPKGYQISQFDRPLASHGTISVLTRQNPSEDLQQCRFRIRRLHLEEDAGKSSHSAEGGTLVDLNRAGVPLAEIVTEPDLRTPAQANDVLNQLRRILLYLAVCDGNMEEGSLRCDANISVRPKGLRQLGIKSEIKNLNSFRSLRRALAYEIERQSRLLEAGEAVRQETRLWDEEREVTVSMRSKEEAHDYRYFPDPDLLPLRLDRRWVDELAAGIGELPEQRRLRLAQLPGLDEETALYLTRERAVADYFESMLAEGTPAVDALNWIRGPVSARLNRDEAAPAEIPVAPAALSRLVVLVDNGTISGKTAKEVLEQMWDSGKEAGEIVESEGLSQISDVDQLTELVESVLAANPDKVEAFRAGKEGLIGFFVGQVMRMSGGRANPGAVQQLLRSRLGSDS